MTRHDFNECELRLREIIAVERQDGCCMADESLISIAMRRWASFDRRYCSSKDRSVQLRTTDLLKAFIAAYPDHNYDRNCLKHLADSFSLVLSSGIDDQPSP